MTTKASPSRIRQHTFEADPDTPLPWSLRGWPAGTGMCQQCKLPGRVGDDRHPDGMLPPPPLSPALAAAYRAHDNAITGEKDDD